MEQKRNYGIDLLRIIATFMIIILHILGVGGVIYTIDASSPVYVTAWLLEFLAYCAVNCYALISGYVGVYSKFRVSNIMALWIQVAFTTLVITGAFYFCGANVTKLDILEACMPVRFQVYWYFTAYFCLFWISPFLNKFILGLSKRASKYLVLVLVVLFSIMPTVLKSDLFWIQSGYSAAWLIVLYIVGGIIRVHYSQIKIRKRVLLAGYLFSVILTLLAKLLIEFLSPKLPIIFYDSNFLMDYDSPTMVLAGVCLLLLFAQIKMKKATKLIAFFAPFTFGIYIIHVHPFVWEGIMTNRFVDFTKLHPVILILAVFLAAIGIFFGCSIIEFLRIRLFKLLHIPGFCKRIERKMMTIFEKLL